MRSVFVTTHVSARAIIGAILRGAWVPEREDMTHIPRAPDRYGVHLRHRPALSIIRTEAPSSPAHATASLMTMIPMWSGHMSPE